MRNYTANIISSSSSPTNAEIEQATTGRARQRERVNIERERAGTGTVTKSTKVRRVSFQDNVVVGNDDTRVFKVVVDEECPSSVMDNDGPVHRLFQKARQLVNPKALYRSMYLYAERKLVILFFIHIVCTLAIWCHFSLIKYNTQRETIPSDVDRYWWKILVPCFEFGSMHAILFQMALLPLTMVRFSITSLSESTFINQMVPLNRMLRMHIHLGYIMIGMVFFATCLFLGFFGLLCSDGDEEACGKFTSEIMITGYSIIGFLLLIGVTSYFRHMIPYELFYAIHHLVFVMYFVTIAHTIDVEQRKGVKDRSQTFVWFSATLLFYFCDRAAMRLNRRYTVRLLESSTVSSNNNRSNNNNNEKDNDTADDSKMIILKTKRPALFRFKPGQHAFLQIRDLKNDSSWHPFSIASDPDSSYLEFYIEVQGIKSWSGKLWKLLEKHDNDDNSNKLKVDIDIMGPYGTSLAKLGDHSHVLAMGAGTGIVPVLSLLKQHVRNMVRLDAETYLREQMDREGKRNSIRRHMEEQTGSIIGKIFGSLCCKKSIKEGKKKEQTITEELMRRISSVRKLCRTHKIAQGSDDDNVGDDNSCNISRKVHGKLQQSEDDIIQGRVDKAKRKLYGIICLAGAPVLGIAVLAVTLSWNTIPMDLYPGMMQTLQALTYLFHVIFIIVSLFIWDASPLWSFIDASISLVTPVANYYWYLQCEQYGRLLPPAITLFCILTGYMTFRLWMNAVQPQPKSWWNTHGVENSNGSTPQSIDKLEVVWSTRSASQVSKIIPDIHIVWDALVQAWGIENAKSVCKIAIHVTDPDPVACRLLQSEMEDKVNGLEINFSRIDIPKWIENHTIDVIKNSRNIGSDNDNQCSHTLLAFCGSPKLAQEIQHYKISNDMITSIAGYKHHQMEFISESYGSKSKPRTSSGGGGGGSGSAVVATATMPSSSSSSSSFSSPRLSPGPLSIRKIQSYRSQQDDEESRGPPKKQARRPSLLDIFSPYRNNISDDNQVDPGDGEILDDDDDDDEEQQPQPPPKTPPMKLFIHQRGNQQSNVFVSELAIEHVDFDCEINNSPPVPAYQPAASVQAPTSSPAALVFNKHKQHRQEEEGRYVNPFDLPSEAFDIPTTNPFDNVPSETFHVLQAEAAAAHHQHPSTTTVTEKDVMMSTAKSPMTIPMSKCKEANHYVDQGEAEVEEDEGKGEYDEEELDRPVVNPPVDIVDISPQQPHRLISDVTIPKPLRKLVTMQQQQQQQQQQHVLANQTDQDIRDRERFGSL